MANGLSRRLMQGTPELNPDMSLSIRDRDGVAIDTLPASMLTNGGMGNFYERVVGLHYERAGFTVEYRSHLGFLDRGVDLIARNPGEQRFIQCKFTLKAMPKARVEQLLFSASSFVKEHLSPGRNFFDLVVPFKDLAFPVKGGENKANFAFYRHGLTQSLVHLNIVEVQIVLPHDFS